MRTSTKGILRYSWSLALAGGLVAVLSLTHCGGSSGGTRSSLGGSTGSLGGASGPGSGGTSGGLGGVTGGGTGGVTVNQCPNGGTLDCTAPLVLADGLVTDFSAMQWSTALGKYCDASGLRGSPFGFIGVSTSDAGQTLGGMASVDTTARNLKLTLGVAPGSYAGAGISFESCVDASSFNAIQFSATLSAGSFDGCIWQMQLQTQEERPSTATSPSGGKCDSTMMTCYVFPAATNLAIPTATPMTVIVPFASFTQNPSVAPMASQLVGLQWQVNSGAAPDGGTQTGCNVEIRIDDITFITQ
jgi:hypothetical protein